MWEPKPSLPEIPPPDPKKRYELNENDRRLLRTYGIKQDQPHPTQLPDPEDDTA